MFEIALECLRVNGVLEAQENSYRLVRLLGIRTGRLEPQSVGVQLALLHGDLAVSELDCEEPWEGIEHMVDRIHAKFGSKGLVPACLLPSPRHGPETE